MKPSENTGKSNSKGFTLIELLVVIAIIGLLSTLAIVALGTARLKSRDARRVADLKQIQTALELYAGDNSGTYPPTSSIQLGDSAHACLNSLGFQPANCTGTVYLANFPKDPNGGNYSYSGAGNDYAVLGSLEGAVNNLSGLIAISPNRGVYGFDSGLVGWWKFDDGNGGPAIDSSGGGNTATWTGTQAGANGYYSPGRVGASGYFNGSNDKLTAGSITVGTNMTIMGWVIKNSSTAQKSFFSNRNGGNEYFGLSFSSVFLYVNSASPSLIQSPSGAVLFGQWQHIAVTSNGSITSMYVNGNLVYSVAQTRSSSTGSVGLGWDPALGTEYWDGQIDDVRIYNRVLSAAEIQSLYGLQK